MHTGSSNKNQNRSNGLVRWSLEAQQAFLLLSRFFSSGYRDQIFCIENDLKRHSLGTCIGHVESRGAEHSPVEPQRRTIQIQRVVCAPLQGSVFFFSCKMPLHGSSLSRWRIRVWVHHHESSVSPKDAVTNIFSSTLELHYDEYLVEWGRLSGISLVSRIAQDSRRWHSTRFENNHSYEGHWDV